MPDIVVKAKDLAVCQIVVCFVIEDLSAHKDGNKACDCGHHIG